MDRPDIELIKKRVYRCAKCDEAHLGIKDHDILSLIQYIEYLETKRKKT